MKEVIKYGILALTVFILVISTFSIIGYINFKQDKQATLDELYNITYEIGEPFEETIGDFDSQAFGGEVEYTFIYNSEEKEIFVTEFDGNNGWGVHFYLEEQPLYSDNLLLWSVEIFYISKDKDKSVLLDFYPDNEFYSQYSIKEWQKRLKNIDYKDIENLIERMGY